MKIFQKRLDKKYFVCYNNKWHEKGCPLNMAGTIENNLFHCIFIHIHYTTHDMNCQWEHVNFSRKEVHLWDIMSTKMHKVMDFTKYIPFLVHGCRIFLMAKMLLRLQSNITAMLMDAIIAILKHIRGNGHLPGLLCAGSVLMEGCNEML